MIENDRELIIMSRARKVCKMLKKANPTQVKKYINYPKIGDKLTAIRSGNTHHIVQKEEGFSSWWESHVTKGRTYAVVDYGDLMKGYLDGDAESKYHTHYDEGRVRLEPWILKRFFGITQTLVVLFGCKNK